MSSSNNARTTTMWYNERWVDFFYNTLWGSIDTTESVVRPTEAQAFRNLTLQAARAMRLRVLNERS